MKARREALRPCSRACAALGNWRGNKDSLPGERAARKKNYICRRTTVLRKDGIRIMARRKAAKNQPGFSQGPDYSQRLTLNGMSPQRFRQ